MSASRFSFMKLVVADLAAAERFYCEVFALEVRRRHASDAHAYGQEESILAAAEGAASVPLILTRYLRIAPPAAGAAWTGFSVDDIEATARAIERSGGRIEVPVHASASHPVKALVARDPEGHMIEVVQLTGEI